MQAQPSKQHCLGHQQRRRDPIQLPRQPQQQGKAHLHAQGNGIIPNLISSCHLCGIDGHVRPSCLHYIKICKLICMIEKKKARAKMHDPLPSRTLDPMTTRNVIETPKWIKKRRTRLLRDKHVSHRFN